MEKFFEGDFEFKYISRLHEIPGFNMDDFKLLGEGILPSEEELSYFMDKYTNINLVLETKVCKNHSKANLFSADTSWYTIQLKTIDYISFFKYSNDRYIVMFGNKKTTEAWLCNGMKGLEAFFNFKKYK